MSDMANGRLPGSLELAYLGDTIYDFYVRRRLVLSGGRMKDLHRAAISQVCASAQSQALARVEELLTEEEQAVVRRARNVRQTPHKNNDPGEYHRSTAFEALLGFLYLAGRMDRLREILAAANPDTPAKEEPHA